MNSKAYLQKFGNKKRRNNREHELQKACVKLFRYQYPRLKKMLFAIPNGANLQGGAMEWNKLLAEGAVPGAADLFLSVPSGDLAGLYIEMKTPKGRQSLEQLEFEQEVLEQGYGYCTPRSSREFERAVKMYLETGYYDKP